MKRSHLFSFAIIWVILFGFLSVSFSQQVTFCEKVNDDGTPVNPSTVFTIPSGGGYLDVLVNGINNTKHVSYIVYYEGQYDNTITQDTQQDWAWCWKEITFYKAGSYIIKIYDDQDQFIVSGNLTIKYQD